MSKESVYGEEINPLMAQVIEICKAHKIAMLADFGLEEDLHCTTALLADEYEPSLEQLEANRILRPKPAFAMAVTEETKPNGDKKITMRRIS